MPSPPRCSHLERSSALLIDDEPMFLRATARVLSRAFDVTCAPSAEAGLALVVSGARFDVVLCDDGLPSMTGPELFKRLCADHPEQAARFVILSGRPAPVDGELMHKLGGRWLRKPVAMDHLLAFATALTTARRAA